MTANLSVDESIKRLRSYLRGMQVIFELDQGDKDRREIAQRIASKMNEEITWLSGSYSDNPAAYVACELMEKARDEYVTKAAKYKRDVYIDAYIMNVRILESYIKVLKGLKYE